MISTRHVISKLICLAMLPIATSQAFAQSPDDNPRWPRDVYAPDGTIVVYQPQIETFDGDRLTARAAVAFEPRDGQEPVYGAMWFESRVATDRDQRLATFYDATVTRAMFPYVDDRRTEDLRRRVVDEMQYWDSTITLDRLVALLELADLDQVDDAPNFDNSAPSVIFRPNPAVLVSIDGHPEYRSVPGSNLMQIINTPFLLLFDQNTQQYFLRGGSIWMSANDLAGPWRDANNPPPAVVELGRDIEITMVDEEAQIGGNRVPEILVTTEAAELIATDGEPNYAPINGTNLLYMTNTDSDVFVDTSSQQRYVLLSGRWYRSRSYAGPWDFVDSRDLPPDFARIDDGSSVADVLPHVYGTRQATDAWADTYIPQTEEIERANVTLDVDYDGDPVFEPIGGTQLAYAANSPFDVVRYQNRYYCCNNAVWYVSSRPRGGWSICDTVPQPIYSIPPTCPIYHVRYVRVYRHTPSTVIVGYTPGYTGCFRRNGVVVYGTGYRYQPWRRTVYYPRPRTFGFGATYNRFTGNWGFQVGFYSGRQWVGFGVQNNRFARTGWRGGLRSNWWGPGGFHAPRHRIVSRGRRFNVRSGLSPNIYVSARRSRGGIVGGSRHYNRVRDRRTTVISKRPRPTQNVRRRSRDNTLFVDRAGQVFRHSMKQGWLERTRDGWRQRDNRDDNRRRDNVRRPTGDRDDRRGNVKRPTRDRDDRRDNVMRPTRDRDDRRRTNQPDRDDGRTRAQRPTRRRSATIQDHWDARKRGSVRTRKYRNYRERTDRDGMERVQRRKKDDGDRKAREQRRRTKDDRKMRDRRTKRDDDRRKDDRRKRDEDRRKKKRKDD